MSEEQRRIAFAEQAAYAASRDAYQRAHSRAWSGHRCDEASVSAGAMAFAAAYAAMPPKPGFDELEAMIQKAIDVLGRQIVPDGISDHDALNELHGIFDGPEYRAALALCK